MIIIGEDAVGVGQVRQDLRTLASRESKLTASTNLSPLMNLSFHLTGSNQTLIPRVSKQLFGAYAPFPQSSGLRTSSLDASIAAKVPHHKLSKLAKLGDKINNAACL